MLIVGRAPESRKGTLHEMSCGVIQGMISRRPREFGACGSLVPEPLKISRRAVGPPACPILFKIAVCHQFRTRTVYWAAQACAGIPQVLLVIASSRHQHVVSHSVAARTLTVQVCVTIVIAHGIRGVKSTHVIFFGFDAGVDHWHIPRSACTLANVLRGQSVAKGTVHILVIHIVDTYGSRCGSAAVPLIYCRHLLVGRWVAGVDHVAPLCLHTCALGAVSVDVIAVVDVVTSRTVQ